MDQAKTLWRKKFIFQTTIQDLEKNLFVVYFVYILCVYVLNVFI
jgi:hypothetical protein